MTSPLSMTTDERQAFLADLHIGVLAVERSDGSPLTTPVWYRYAAGGDVEIVTSSASEKFRLLQAAGRASLCAQREAPPYAYVTVEGTVELSAADEDTLRDIASRYLGAEGGAQFATANAAVDDTLVRLRTDNWRTSDYAKLDASGDGDGSAG